ncbi:MAG: hypothetical protein DCC55_13585 [Chloroflexi bacterium]|nr:MAG: hypothetical protein DCC55_13585 [Chloroflexota bacterium]
MAGDNATGVDRANLTESMLDLEEHKSNLILEANLLQLQGEYEAAADKFAESAAIEEQLATQLLDLGKLEKAYFHHFSALSCWVQAGDLHRALVLGQQLLQAEQLSTNQRTQIIDYLNILRSRLAQWMDQWRPEPIGVPD